MTFLSWLFSLMRNSIDIVKGQLFSPGYILDREQGKIMYMFISMITHACKDSHVGLAGVVDKARWARHKLAINLKGRSFESGVERVWVGEFVQREKVNVLAL